MFLFFFCFLGGEGLGFSAYGFKLSLGFCLGLGGQLWGVGVQGLRVRVQDSSKFGI